MTSNPDPAPFGQPLTLNATVTEAGGTPGVPTGTVTFNVNGNDFGTVSVDGSGHASLSVNSLVPNTTVTAHYDGDSEYLPSRGRTEPNITFDQVLTGKQPGSMVLAGGTWLVKGATIRTGGLFIGQGASVVILKSTITGGIHVTNGRALDICTTIVHGDIQITGASGPIVIGDHRDDGCGGNHIGGNVNVNSTTHGFELDGNNIVVNVNLTAVSGSGALPEDTAPSVEHNKIQGNIACTGNSPPPTDDGNSNNIGGAASGQCSGM